VTHRRSIRTLGAGLWSCVIYGATQVRAAPFNQDAIAAAGPQAAHIAHLWNVMLAVCLAVFIGVMVALAIAIIRAPQGNSATPPDSDALAREERPASRAVVLAVLASTAGLALVFLASVHAERALAGMDRTGALHITLTGHQYWWEAQYDDPAPAQVFITANELHVPVGRPVIFTLLSDDVIHSFWVPNVHGKKDLIPGHSATFDLRVDQPGTYRGQCAEFCGYQHAHMALLVVAEAPDEFDRWAQRQRQPAAEPAAPYTKRGRDVFLASTCAMCHAVSGTTASARKAPDLTHLASRSTLAAGTLPNKPENLARWIEDPQRYKPGVNMPPHALPQQDAQALVAWLGTLQ